MILLECHPTLQHLFGTVISLGRWQGRIPGGEGTKKEYLGSIVCRCRHTRGLCSMLVPPSFKEILVASMSRRPQIYKVSTLELARESY